MKWLKDVYNSWNSYLKTTEKELNTAKLKAPTYIFKSIQKGKDIMYEVIEIKE